MIKLTRAKKGIVISLLGSFFNLILSSLKIAIGLIAGSISVLLDGVNNFIDIFSAGATAIGFGVADMESNERYPNGYGKIEYIISLLISIVVLFVGITFVYSAIDRLLLPQPIAFSWMYFYVILATALTKVLMGEFYRRNNKTLESSSLAVMVVDSYQDAAITITVLMSFVVSRHTRFPIDAICALVMATILFINCGKLAAEAFKKLLGRVDVSLKNDIKTTIDENKDIKCQNIMLYDYGYKNCFGYATVEIKDSLSRQEATVLVKEIEQEIKREHSINMNIKIN